MRNREHCVLLQHKSIERKGRHSRKKLIENAMFELMPDHGPVMPSNLSHNDFAFRISSKTTIKQRIHRLNYAEETIL
jgi:hypothetical protein